MTLGKRRSPISYSPARISASQTPTPAATSRMRTWSSFGLGTGSIATWSTSGPPYLSMTAARICSGIEACMVLPPAYVGHSAEPLRVVEGSVVLVGHLERLVLPLGGHLRRPVADVRQRLLRERSERARCVDRLIEDLHPLAPGDDDRGGHRERVVQAFDRAHRAGPQGMAVRERLHSQDRDSIPCQLGKHLPLEALEVPVQRIDRHLHGVEPDTMGAGDLEHVEVDVRALVAGESDEADLAGLAGSVHRLPGTSRGEYPFRVVSTDDLVKLHQIEVVGPESAE